MGRLKGSKNKSTGRRFKKFEGRWPNDKHVRLTKDMLMDKSFKNLSGNAVRLYMYMKLWAIGHDELDYSASMAAPFMSNKTFFKARDELVAAGFIDFPNRHCARDKRETGHYAFSDRWQGIAVPSPKPTKIDIENELTEDFVRRLDENMSAREHMQTDTVEDTTTAEAAGA